MRKCTAIFLLSIFIFSNTEFHELGKIGAFIGHFHEHCADNPKTTLLSFIQLHYFSGITHDEDYSRDMQLPFKAIDCTAPGIVFTLPQETFLALPPTLFEVKNKVTPHDQAIHASSHLSDIWQPPKSC